VVDSVPSSLLTLLLAGVLIARDVDDYQRFVFDKLSKLANIATYRSTLIMRVVKHTTVLPV